MVNEQRPPWERPGYGDIAAARIVDGILEVQFENGDVQHVDLSSLGFAARSDATLKVEDGLSIQFGDESAEVSWMAIRSATDAAYARHLRDVDANESGRLGRRLKALREDRELSQAELAARVRISV